MARSISRIDLDQIKGIDEDNDIIQRYINIISFNVAIITNENECQAIVRAIADHNPTIIILHETDAAAIDYFTAYITSLISCDFKPYINNNKNGPLTIIYSCMNVAWMSYIDLSTSNSIAHLRCDISNGNMTNRDGLDKLDIYAVSIVTSNIEETDAMYKAIKDDKLMGRTNAIFSISLTGNNSHVLTPDLFGDVWTCVGKPQNLKSTLNIETCVNCNINNERADRIWVKNVIPISMTLLRPRINVEHLGISTYCMITNSSIQRSDSRLGVIVKCQSIKERYGKVKDSARQRMKLSLSSSGSHIEDEKNETMDISDCKQPITIEKSRVCVIL